MTEVVIHRSQWIRIRQNLVADIAADMLSYHLDCGLSISVKNVTTPETDGWTGHHYIVRFEEEKDAVWFVLAVGGEIVL